VREFIGIVLAAVACSDLSLRESVRDSSRDSSAIRAALISHAGTPLFGAKQFYIAAGLLFCLA